MQTHFFNFLHQTSDFYHHLTYLCGFCFGFFLLLPCFQDPLWWKQEKKTQQTVNTKNLRQPRRLLTLNFLKTSPFSSPHQSAFPRFCALFCFVFFSKWNLVTQIVAFLYVAYKQREVSISAYTNFFLNNDLISLEQWDDLQDLILEQTLFLEECFVFVCFLF